VSTQKHERAWFYAAKIVILTLACTAAFGELAGSSIDARTTSSTPQLWQEREELSTPVHTFRHHHSVSSAGPTIAAGQRVLVSCKVYDPSIPSVKPGGYWYRIASKPWNNHYYAPANTFLNGDPPNGPFTHPVDRRVRNC
jgi:hypothetical protein